MENMFHTAYYVVKKEKPFTDFPDLVQLNSRTGSNMTNYAMEEKVLKPTNLKGARWLPYIHKATQILCNSYAIFVAHSEDQVSPERSAQRGHPDLHLQ
ncbi:Zinc finger protein 862 [Dissostichus eleginoides]|uniref:Zinc finger protein 862 n=1 Tax=Dissostichus eleginoides TaxID=100907 RepID=A0AAD9FDV2_DISEL|nr:Zinc finger protein 862 [Dissostichus eleginoides]